MAAAGQLGHAFDTVCHVLRVDKLGDIGQRTIQREQAGNRTVEVHVAGAGETHEEGSVRDDDEGDALLASRVDRFHDVPEGLQVTMTVFVEARPEGDYPLVAELGGGALEFLAELGHLHHPAILVRAVHVGDAADFAFDFDFRDVVLDAHHLDVAADSRAVVAPEQAHRGVHVGEDVLDLLGLRRADDGAGRIVVYAATKSAGETIGAMLVLAHNISTSRFCAATSKPLLVFADCWLKKELRRLTRAALLNRKALHYSSNGFVLTYDNRPTSDGGRKNCCAHDVLLCEGLKTNLKKRET